MFTCQICGKEYKNIQGLSQHIGAFHKNITKEEYYLTYMKINDNRICPICGKPTRFLGLSYGYQKHCSLQCASLDDETKSKREQTNNERFGANYNYQTKQFQENAKRVKKERYGDEHYNNRDLYKQNNLKKYGVENTTSLSYVQEKMKQTNLERYGTSVASKSDTIKAKQKEQCLSKYGTSSYVQTDDFKKKAKQTNIANYGTPFPTKTIKIKQKMKKTCLEKYGVPYYVLVPSVMQKANSPEAIAKMHETKRKNGTFNTSRPEEQVYTELTSIFNEVKRNYRSDQYPHLCDFYIPQLDLYIECNFHWTHGGHWYNNDNLDLWKQRAKESSYYKIAIGVWTKSDVKKRKDAEKNNLNYIVFWEVADLYTWISLGCPIGRDWEHEYSWLPNRELQSTNNIIPLSDKSSICTKIAKQAQFNEFYKRELMLWRTNPFKKNGTLQSNLYNNRLYYIGKTPNQLTDAEILRGLCISGTIRAFSSFDNNGMKVFLDKYNIHSIYDPCAGWGERLLTCASKQIEYFGVDINPQVISGHQKLIQTYNLTNQNTIIGDSSVYIPQRPFEATFTCPPYWNTEIYTENGAENLSYEDFLKWWDLVVKNSNTPIFAYQINQRYEDDMNRIILQNGYTFVEEISTKTKSSHFTRKNGNNTKKERETIQVFKKIL